MLVLVLTKLQNFWIKGVIATTDIYALERSQDCVLQEVGHHQGRVSRQHENQLTETESL